MGDEFWLLLKFCACLRLVRSVRIKSTSTLGFPHDVAYSYAQTNRFNLSRCTVQVQSAIRCLSLLALTNALPPRWRLLVWRAGGDCAGESDALCVAIREAWGIQTGQRETVFQTTVLDAVDLTQDLYQQYHQNRTNPTQRLPPTARPCARTSRCDTSRGEQ